MIGYLRKAISFVLSYIPNSDTEVCFYSPIINSFTRYTERNEGIPFLIAARPFAYFLLPKTNCHEENQASHSFFAALF